jgi:hypothetical protein
MSGKTWPELTKENDLFGFFYQVLETEPAHPDFFVASRLRTARRNRFDDAASRPTNISVITEAFQMKDAHAIRDAVFRTPRNGTESAIWAVIGVRVESELQQSVAAIAMTECFHE